MSRETWRHTDAVEVPDVVGLSLPVARARAHEAGVSLAQPDPDGPPLAALTWPGEYVVTGQSPAPGARLWRWDSVVVSWTADNEGTAGVREPLRPRPSPDTLRAATPLSDRAGHLTPSEQRDLRIALNHLHDALTTTPGGPR